MTLLLSPGWRRVALGLLSPLGVCVGALAQAPDNVTETSIDEARAAFDEWSAVTSVYEEVIADEESQNGPHSGALLDPLVALGFAHQEYGRHDLAIESLDRALQVKRVNDGLYDLGQAQLLTQLIASHTAVGDATQAAALHRRMTELARLNINDARAIPILIEAGDRQLAQYERYLEEGFPPDISFGASVGGRRYLSGSSLGRAGFGLVQARRNYRDAIFGLIGQGSYAQEALPELERKLIRTYYLQMPEYVSMSQRNTAFNPATFPYEMGRRSYRRLLMYKSFNPGSTLEYAKVLVDLADWDLLFSLNSKALEQYEEAYRLLVDADVEESSIREIFAPETPILLPTFLPNPFAGEGLQDGAAHIDVAFEVSKYGRSRKVQIVDASEDATHEAERDMVRIIASNRFRPIMADNESFKSAPFNLRYYVPGDTAVPSD